MQKNNINLRQITTKDDLQGLKVLKNILNDKEAKEESPVPEEINEYLYLGFLKLSEDESKDKLPCFRYWITLDNEIIVYYDIKEYIKNDILGANIGIILTKEYRNKGIGYDVMQKLINNAKNNLHIEEIIISTKKNNKSMNKLCEKLGAELINMDDECQYIIK